jgi:hypothetical protein
MPINIADQFKVNVALPIDSRIVASGSNKDLIQFKYDGLRVFDTTNRLTYIWNATTSTFSVADINGSGQTNYMTRWSSTGLTSSGIYYAVGSSINKGNVGINTSSPQGVLQINSDTGSSQPFVIHKGASTLLAYNFYNDGTDRYFAPNVGSGAIRFIDDGSIDFLNRSSGIGNPAINSSNEANLAFRIQSGTGRAFLFRDLVLSGNTTNPQTSLYLRSLNTFSTAANPDVTWYNDDNTGIFHPAFHQIGFSIQGSQRARLTSTGLLLGASGTLLTPFNKLHLDNGNGVASYLQFTAGTTTTTGAAAGFLVGINASGYPILQSFNNFAISTTFGGKHQHKLDINSFTIYSDPAGVGFNDITGFTGRRVTRVTKSKSTNYTGAQNLVITGFSVPSSSMCSLEITFVTALKITIGGTFQYKTQKLLISFSVDSSGTITAQNTGATLPAGGLNLESHDIKTLTSTSATNIGKGFLTYSTNFVNIYQQLNIVAPSISYTATVVIDYKLIVNQHGL